MANKPQPTKSSKRKSSKRPNKTAQAMARFAQKFDAPRRGHIDDIVPIVHVRRSDTGKEFTVYATAQTLAKVRQEKWAELAGKLLDSEVISHWVRIGHYDLPCRACELDGEVYFENFFLLDGIDEPHNVITTA